MRVFTDEFKQKCNKICDFVGDELSQSSTYLILNFVVFFALAFGAIILSIFADVGFQAWGQYYFAKNPNVILEQTVQYWIFIIGIFVLKVAVFLQAVTTFLVFIAWAIRENRGYKERMDAKLPVCPNCKNNMAIVKNGTRGGKTQFFCKTCGKYFVKKEKVVTNNDNTKKPVKKAEQPSQAKLPTDTSKP